MAIALCIVALEDAVATAMPTEALPQFGWFVLTARLPSKEYREIFDESQGKPHGESDNG